MKKMEHVNESGEVMLEGLIVYTITVFLLFFLLAIFSVLFQAWNVQTIANETAAQIYRLESADVVTGYVTEEQLTDMPIYRYLKNRTELEMAARQKIMDYASNRLIKTTYTKAMADPQINVEIEKDSIARRHVKVTVTGDYTVPFGEALSYFGFESVAHYETTSYAECVDLLDYIGTVDFVDNQTSLGQFGSETVGLVNSVMKLFNDIRGLIAD